MTSDVLRAAFLLKDVHACVCEQVLGAGQYNGQFVLFDMRQGSAAVDATPIDKSHRYAPTGHPFKRSTRCSIHALGRP